MDMDIIVKSKYLRISSRKVRLVADLVRGKKALEARTLLGFTRKKAAEPVAKLLRSGLATATKDFQLREDNLYIAEIFVNEGPTLKRWRPRARGRVFPINKRTAHLSLILKEVEPTKKKKTTKKAAKPKIVKVTELPAEVKEERVVEEAREEKMETKRPKPRFKLPRPKFGNVSKRVFRRKAF